MNVSSILHEALARDIINLGHGLDFTGLLKRDNKTLKSYDQRLTRVLDEYGSRDCLYRDYPTIAKISEDASLLRKVRTFFNYTYKVEVAPSKQQINETIKSFLERNSSCQAWARSSTGIRRAIRRGQSRMGSHEGDPDRSLYEVLAVSRYLCHRRTVGYRTPAEPAHGPGVTSNAGSRRIDKYASISRDIPPSLKRFREWFVPSLSYISDFQSLDWPSECKLRAVPKDARGPRLVAPHSASHMWMQQAVSRRLCRLLTKQEQWYKYHPLFDEQMSTIQFDDQLVNAGLALFGSSRPGLYGTLDLSDASDRIPWSLVTTVMPQRLLRDLTAVRARKVLLPDGSSERIYMHAPMGSACCFPVLSLVAWSVACAAIWLETHSIEDLGRGTIPSEFDYVWVFGDDIILHPSHITTVTKAFSLVNLAVNEKKSFCGEGGFRESCGLDAYGCEEITPVRLRVDGVSSVPDLMALISHHNQVMDEGLNCTAKVCRDLIEIIADELGCRHLIGATTDARYRSTSIVFPDLFLCTQWNMAGGVVQRRNKKLQRHEIRAFCFQDSYSNVNLDLDSRSRLFEGVLGNRARPVAGWARNRPRPRVMWVPLW